MQDVIPREIRTARLLLRPWTGADAAELLPVLESNHAHLSPWIPATVSTPTPIPELTQRLAGFGEDFDAGRACRFRVALRESDALLGGVGLYPRDASRRVRLLDADRLELGYWLRQEATGQGFISEAARGVLAAAAATCRFRRVELRCDSRNEASVNVARRLGFSRDAAEEDLRADCFTQVWESELQTFAA
jgi:RimJ/RimL family protein N-acetyltransferase